jgi:hypothetical protein
MNIMFVAHNYFQGMNEKIQTPKRDLDLFLFRTDTA